MERIFITGATGFVGTHIVNALYESGYETVALVRSIEKARKKNIDKKAELVKGDILDTTSLKTGMKDCDAVIHLVGIIREVKGATFEKIHYIGTKNVVEATKSADIERYLHMSALGTRKDAKSRYHKTKYMAEEYVRASGLKYTIFRPSVIFGEGDEFINKLISLTKLPIVPIIPSGRLMPIYVKNVAEAFVKSLENEKSFYKTYELCGTCFYTIEEIIDLILKIKGAKRLKVKIPYSLIKILAKFLEKLPNQPLNTDQVIMLSENNICKENEFVSDLNIDLVNLSDYLKKIIK